MGIGQEHDPIEEYRRKRESGNGKRKMRKDIFRESRLERDLKADKERKEIYIGSKMVKRIGYSSLSSGLSKLVLIAGNQRS